MSMPEDPPPPDPIVETLAPMINLLVPAAHPNRVQIMGEFTDELAASDAGAAAARWVGARPNAGRIYTGVCVQAEGWGG